MWNRTYSKTCKIFIKKINVTKALWSWEMLKIKNPFPNLSCCNFHGYSKEPPSSMTWRSPTDNMLWWLILCLNLTGPQGSDIWSNIIVGASGRVFVHELTFKSVDWVKQMPFLVRVGLVQSVEGWQDQKTDGPPTKTEFHLPERPSVFWPWDLTWNLTSSCWSQFEPVDLEMCSSP